MSIGVCINKDIENLSRKRATRSVVHRALLLGRWQDERALILFRFAVSQQFSRGVAKKKKGTHATCTKCDTSSARTLEELGSDENGGQEKGSNERSAHRGRERVLLTSLLQERQRRNLPLYRRVGGCRSATDLHPLAIRIDCGTLRRIKSVLRNMSTLIL